MKILVVDDEPKMTKLLRLILEEHLQCEVETFNDPQLALQRLDQAEFDVISLDQRMPGLMGMEIVNILRTSTGVNQKTPVLIFTGYREEAERLNIWLLDDVIFLEKPIDDARFVTNVKIAAAMKKNATSA